MSDIVNRFKSFMGLLTTGFADDSDIYEELYGADEEDDAACCYPVQDNLALKPEYETRRNSNLRVLNNTSRATTHELVVLEPRSFEDALDIVSSLRDKKSVILNLHILDNEQSQRIIDFLAGATHAIDGHQQKIGEGVFIFAPSSIAISAEEEKVKALKDAFWTR